MAFKSVNSYGMDAEIAQRMQDKYDKGLEERTQVWIEGVTGITFDKEFGVMLKDGVVLCAMVNALLPGRIKNVYTGAMPFNQRENISQVIKVMREIGVPEASLFTTEALYELKDLGQVLVGISAFSQKIAQRRDDLGVTYDGPFLGAPAKAATLKKGQFGAAAAETKAAQPTGTLKKKWVVKPGGSAAVSLLNQGSAGIMEQQKYTDAREQIKRNQLDGKGTGAAVSMLNQGSAGIMEETKFTDAREQIKRNQLDGKGTGAAVSMLNQGSAGIMEETKYTDAREQIKRNQLEGAGSSAEVSQWNKGSSNMERLQYNDPREQIKRGDL